MRRFNHKKATQALNLFAIHDGGTCNKLKAIKLVWLADRLHLRRWGRTITNDKYYAMEFGPVPSATFNLVSEKAAHLDVEAIEYAAQFLAKSGPQTYDSIARPMMNVFSETDVVVLNEILQSSYASKTGRRLSEISHLYDEWRAKSEKLAHRSRAEMSLDDFFKGDSDAESIFKEAPEDVELARRMFKERV